MRSMNGILVKQIAGFYYVEAGDTVYECRARGIFRRQGQTPLAGDRVEISANPDGTGVLEAICDRKNSLIRPPLANLDRLWIVSSYCTPAPNPLLIDKLIAIAEDKGIEPALIFSKSDLGDFSEWQEIYRNAGFLVCVVSSVTKEGLPQLKKELSGRISAFTGNSGVGKSSLLNALYADLNLVTGAVSEKLGRGRHTTRQAELFKLPEGGYIADTPGFSSLDLEKTEMVHKENLVLAFRDFLPYLGQCRFTSCSHTGEKGCAVREAVDGGKISVSRYESYCSMYRDVKAVKEWELPGGSRK